MPTPSATSGVRPDLDLYQQVPHCRYEWYDTHTTGPYLVSAMVAMVGHSNDVFISY